MTISVSRLAEGFAARLEFCYRHERQEGDLVIWDNHCVLHRATPFDTTRRRRLMQRTTVSGTPDVTPAR
jgi:alpha-ketoglutarate-dependent taurine dioxygenase